MMERAREGMGAEYSLAFSPASIRNLPSRGEAGMDFFECVGSRRSVRAYRAEPVEEEKLGRLLEAGLRKIYDRDRFVAAPLVLAVCALPAEAWTRKDGKNYADVDAAIAMDHMALAAGALGLGTCWIANFDAGAAREVLCLEAGWEPLAFTPLGYPEESPEPRPRKAIAALALRP
jgi:nitroreductase